MSTLPHWQPAEWEAHKAVWSAWPSAADLWEDNLEPARKEFAALCEAIADIDPETGKARGEALHILVREGESEASARAALGRLGATLHVARFGDIWLRDTAPVFLKTASGGELAACFRFNGWGEKYQLDGDTEVAAQISQLTGVSPQVHDLVFEGGAIDVDGQGTAITTRECLLNPNRNPRLNADQIEEVLKGALGFRKLIWIDRGLLNDHTDGHLDNIARFIGPGKVVCMSPQGPEDPNADTYRMIRQALAHATTAGGEPLQIVELPSPGAVLDEEGEIIPASHLNFYISNTRVIVPHYGTVDPVDLIERLAPHFPGRTVVVLPSKAILSGGGSFHCITQQQPV